MGLRSLIRSFRKKGGPSALKAGIEEAYRARFGADGPEDEDGLRRVRFDRDGAVDYELYREIQNRANAQKIGNQWLNEARVANLAALLRAYRPEPSFGICHGTRSGAEQAWFAAALGCRVIGTEIADSAHDFPDTVQWDFHEPNPDWAGKADFVYSNSWDHAYDPEKAFGAWIETLVPGGVMLLDHSSAHTPKSVSAMDPFGAELDALGAALDRWFGDRGRVAELRKTGRRHEEEITTLAFVKR